LGKLILLTLLGLLLATSALPLVASFDASLDYGAGDSPCWVAVGDFNDDGRADLAVANNGSDDVSILLGRSDGTFAPSVSYSAGDGPYSVASGDFDQDGHTDLAVTDYDSGNISILLGSGNGTFEPAVK
jgi:hypothetical protein